MGKIITKLKEYSSIIIAILIIIAFVVPYILLYFYLKKKGQELSIYPTVTIKSIKTNSTVDKNALADGLRISQEILKRIKK